MILDFSAFKVSLLTVNHVHTLHGKLFVKYKCFKISVWISYTSTIGKPAEMNLIGRFI